MAAKSSQSKRFKCQHCDYSCKSKGALTRHNNKLHDGRNNKIGEKIVDDGSYALKPQEERFCQLYASDREFFCNGVQSYIEAYKVDVGKGKGKTSYEYCRFAAHRLLKKRKITTRINEIYQSSGLNDPFVDKQLEKLITQDAEFRPKLGAIQEYNRLKKRTTNTVEHVHAFADIRGLSDEEIQREKEKLQNFFQKK